MTFKGIVFRTLRIVSDDICKKNIVYSLGYGISMPNTVTFEPHQSDNFLLLFLLHPVESEVAKPHMILLPLQLFQNVKIQPNLRLACFTFAFAFTVLFFASLMMVCMVVCFRAVGKYAL